LEQTELCVLWGRAAVESHADVFAQLAERCGQAGGMHWFGYFLGGVGRFWKHPCAVVFARAGADLSSLQADDLVATVLYFELRVLGIGTGAFSTDDKEAIRTVIAPEGLRSRVAAQAAEVLLRERAQVVLTTYACVSEEAPGAGSMVNCAELLLADRCRRVKKQIALQPTYDEMLARLGKRTRTNLRYYRKKFLEKMECEYVADARQSVTEAEAAALNSGALNRVAGAEALRRHRCSRDLPGSFLVALRGADRELLSLIGGWRHGTTTVLMYQVNAAGYERDSMTTVMRSFFLRSEIERGARKLICYRGTHHSMGHSFDDEVVRDLVVRRRTMRASILCRLAGLMVTARGGSSTFFAMALSGRPEKHVSTPTFGTATVGRTKRNAAMAAGCEDLLVPAGIPASLQDKG
jgi:hypothetical protein